jgi:membrane-associated phospholipid phosphatase
MDDQMTNDASRIGRIGRPAAGCLACAAGLVVLTWLAYDVDPIRRFDVAALARTTLNRESSFAPLAKLCVHIGDPGPVLALTIVAGALGLACGRPRQAIAAVTVVAGASLTTLWLKSLLAHPRFDPALGYHQITPTAFPSGHSTAAMAVSLAFVLAVSPSWRPLAVLAGASLAFAVSFFLIFLGHHFPSDVLGGWLVASAWCFAAVVALRSVALISTRIGPGDRKLSQSSVR